MSDAASGLRVRCKNCEYTFSSKLVSVTAASAVLKGNIEQCPFCLQWFRLPDGKMGHLAENQPLASSERDLKYLDAKPYFSLRASDLFEVKTPQLIDPAMSFFNALTRLHGMLEFPVTVTWLARLFQEMKDKAVRELGEPDDDEARSRIDQRIQELVTEWLKSKTREEIVVHATRYGAGTFGRLRGGGALWHGKDAILVAQITGMWTAFEAFAGDLWIAAVNCHPQCLAELTGKPKDRIHKRAFSKEKPSNKEKDDGGGPQKQEEKSVKLEWLRSASDNSYDLSECMGSVLSQRFTFSRLESIREAYSVAFPKKHAGDIDKALSDKAIDALQVVRNAIVHKGGVVDAQYVDRSESIPAAPKHKKSERIALDGSLVHSLISPVVTQSVQLLKAVDHWLKSPAADNSKPGASS